MGYSVWPVWLFRVLWDSTEVVSCCLSRVTGLGSSQPKPFVYTSPAENSATLHEKGEVDL